MKLLEDLAQDIFKLNLFIKLIADSHISEDMGYVKYPIVVLIIGRKEEK